MHNILAVMLQTDLYQAAQTSPGGSTSIWGHMSDALRESIYCVLSLLISILPGILALILAMAVFTLIGMALSTPLRRGLAAVRFDDRLARRRGNVNWVPSASPAALIARLSFWACVLLGLIIGVSAFDASFATAKMLPSFLLPYLSRVIGGVLLLISGTLIARFLPRSILIEAVNAQLEYARLLSIGVKWLVLVLTAAMVLGHVQLGDNVVELAFGILFGGIVLTLALAAGLGSRDLVSRSLESRAEHSGEHAAAPPAASAATPPESIRHF